MEYFGKAIGNFLATFVDPAEFLSPLPLLVAFAIAFAVIAARRRDRGFSVGRTLRLMFPRRVLLHRSALRDYAILVINNGLLFFLGGALILGTPDVVRAVHAAFGRLGAAPTGGETTTLELALFSIYLMLVWDFAATFAHYLKHRVPVLWEFHKVHHSAEVMTPVTALRRHPVEDIVGTVIIVAILGVATALWQLAFASTIQSSAEIMGLAAGIYLWRLLGYNLRHTHIWLSYGPFWSRIFISPAQHQVHHSDDPRHFDTNFGHIFAFWDRLFGTLYVPAADERVRFGIAPDDMKRMRSLRGLYLAPFVQVARRFWKPVRRPAPSER